MTNRFLPDYLVFLGATGFIVGLFATLGNAIGAVYPYYGGVVSDRVGSRFALTIFGFVSVIGFGIWFASAFVPAIPLGFIEIPPWIWVFVGLLLAQCWKSFGIGGHYAIVKQSVPPNRLARGFASTETFRRSAFLVAPVIVAVLVADALMPGFLWVLVIAIVFGLLGTVAQHFLYAPDADTVGKEFEGFGQIVDDIKRLPEEHRPLIVADTLVRFANGMVYVFFILVVTRIMGIGLTVTLPTVGTIELSPAAFFGVLLAVEMLIALVSMAPMAIVAERTGLKTVVGLGFAVYAIFPVLIVSAPASQVVLIALFAFSGLRFAGLPAHKALIVGPAERDTGGRVSGSYYLLRNAVVVPSAALGGLIYGGFSVPGTGVSVAGSPTFAFGLASAVGLVGVAYFALFGEEYDAYA
jgi:hypothetical protein